MQIRFIDRLSDIAEQDWNRLSGSRNPFVDHRFLHALEASGCVGPGTGWQPHHLVAHEGEALVAAVPLYLKGHSWGEFVFDWSWADAYQRTGRAYYPKLIAAAPFSPISGARLLRSAAAATPSLGELAEAVRGEAERLQLSSLHWLFPLEEQARGLEAAGFMLREGYQFHWENAGYPDFDAFLTALSSKKRKNIRRERQQVADAGLQLRTLHGDEVEPHVWRSFYRFYSSTCELYGRPPPLNQDFFERLGAAMGRQLVLVLAEDGGPEPVAGALFLRDDDTLYGRYWGCVREYPGLHFEACYYQGIEYCIRHGLGRVEPGAQGEHKIARGFLPRPTWSAHWLAAEDFAAAVGDFLARERPLVDDYRQQLRQHSPYRQ